MNENYLKEKANSLRNEMNHLWGAIFITGGGSVGFSIFEEKTLLIYAFLILGIFWTIVFVNAYFVKRIELMKIIEKFKNGGV